jgi:hypothetical protein
LSGEGEVISVGDVAVVFVVVDVPVDVTEVVKDVSGVVFSWDVLGYVVVWTVSSGVPR